MIATKRMKSS